MVSFIIPSLNGKRLLKKCLESVFTAAENAKVRAEVIVVDNGSKENIKYQISNIKNANKKLRIALIQNKKNLGFAKAVNQGIGEIEKLRNYEINQLFEDFVVVLNNDITLEQNWLGELLKTIKKNDKIGAIQGRNLTADGKKIEGTGLIYFLNGGCLNRGNGEINDRKRYNKEEEVFGVSAAASLYRLSALEEVGYFDDDFFAFEEDIDLSLRLKASGFKSFYNPRAIAYHIGGATVNKMGNLRARMDAKNWIYIIIKNYPLRTLLCLFPQIFIERLRNLSGLIKETIKIYGAAKSFYLVPLSILLTYGEVLAKLPKMIKKRKSFFIDKL